MILVFFLLVPLPSSLAGFNYFNYANNLAIRTCDPNDEPDFPGTHVLKDMEPCEAYGLCFENECADLCASEHVPLGAVCGLFGTCEIRNNERVCANSCNNDFHNEPSWKSSQMAESVNMPCGSIGDCIDRDCKDPCSASTIGAACGFFGICSSEGKCTTTCDTEPGIYPNYWLMNQLPVCARLISGAAFSRRGVCVDGYCNDPCRLAEYTVRI